MKPNRFKQVVAEGRIPVGHMVMEFGTRGLAKIMEAVGVDFVIIDMEHTGFEAERVADLMAWFKATPVAPFVRVPQGFYHFLARTMDAGALGVMVANVETGEQARSIVDAVKYAPLGARGVALSVAHTDYTAPPAAEYFAEANANTTVICLIESAKGLENLDPIASTPGVDVLWVGHYDLTQSMGIPGQFQHPRFLEAIRRVIETARRHGKQVGILPQNEKQATEWIAAGFNVISWSVDISVYRDALAQSVRWLRSASPHAS